MQVVIFYHTKALRDLNTRIFRFVPLCLRGKLFSQQIEPQGLNAKEIAAKFRHVVTTVSKFRKKNAGLDAEERPEFQALRGVWKRFRFENLTAEP
jgi:hypothetical protein